MSERIPIFITRWGLTEGVVIASIERDLIEPSGKICMVDEDGPEGTSNTFYMERDEYALTLEEASAKVRAMAERKVRSLERRLRATRAIADRQMPKTKPWSKRRNWKWVDDYGAKDDFEDASFPCLLHPECVDDLELGRACGGRR